MEYSDFEESSISKIFKYIYTITFGSIYFSLCNIIAFIIFHILKFDLQNILFFYIALIPSGPSFAALIYVINNLKKKDNSHVTKEFFKGYKKNFKASLKIWTIILTITTILIFDLLICFKNNKFPILIIPMTIMLIFILLVLVNSFPILCRYEINTINNIKLSINTILRKPSISITNLAILIIWLNLLNLNNLIIKILISGVAIFAMMKVYDRNYVMIDNSYLNDNKN